jgi:hypothetical protein
MQSFTASPTPLAGCALGKAKGGAFALTAYSGQQKLSL